MSLSRYVLIFVFGILAFLVVLWYTLGLDKRRMNQESILLTMDSVFNSKTHVDYTNGHKISSEFFPSFTDFYFYLAGSKIHLYSGDEKWAIVFEKCGYDFGGFAIKTELNYFGHYTKLVENGNQANYISNCKTITHLNSQEIARQFTQVDSDSMEYLRKDHSNTINLNGRILNVEDDTTKYEALGIDLELNASGRKVIQIIDVLRFIHATNPEALFVSESQIAGQLDPSLKKLMTIGSFHYPVSLEFKEQKPSETELFNLLSNVIAQKDTSIWKPKATPNNHWRFWEEFRI